MALKIADRGRVPPFIVMDVLREANARAAAGHGVLHLEVGQPGAGAPAGVIAAAQRAMTAGPLGYSEALGVPALRRRIARHYAEAYGVELDPQRVVVTPGSSGAFILAFLAAFEAGDRVALAAPGYPAYRNILSALGLEVVEVPVGPAERFQPTPELLRACGRLDGVIVASPSNPTGTMLDRPALEALARYCSEAGVRLISDEIYHGITYDAPAVSALETGDEAIVVNSFSKYYAMTGWRLGWLVLPPELVRPVECLAQNLFIAASTLSQEAALAAFDCGDELEGHVQVYARNRARLLAMLRDVGLDGDVAPPDGAFYLYLDVGRFTNDSPQLCRRLLQETGVALTPGLDFDPARGHRTLRISFAASEADVAEAADRLAAWFGKG